ncbi:MAG: hypothetical protein JSS61_02060 [Verrucomicrobia bacterium]|nr:hypothetical protein [Verrucomicrobiota bacterium]
MTVHSRDALQRTLRPIEDASRTLESDDDFRRLMKVDEISEEQPEKNLYELIEEEHAAGIAPCPAPSILLTTPTAQAVASTTLPASLEALFEKTASAMLVMHSQQETETTLFIDHPDSLFCGTRITIREFSTAPLSYNIEIGSHPALLATLELHKATFLAAFQRSNFPFSIHRLDTHIEQVEDRPVFHRKESDDHKQEEGHTR